MNGQHAPHQNWGKNKQFNSNKRRWQPSENPFTPNHKRFKINEDKTEINDVNIVEQLKLKLKSILTSTKLFKTTIDDVEAYGSRISGIYTDESDVDFHISFTSIQPIKKVILSFANSLRHNSHVFINVVPIVHAKIPIIKCTHRSTGIDCDISFNNISAVHNSHLLNHIISMDDRIKPVLMKLKAWAKHVGLICTNGFSSYSFYWLGLFSMQVMGILPSIHNLQKSIPELIVGPWNCAFSIDCHKFIKRQTTLSEDDILDVIYSYYSAFDFNTLVISPYIGCSLIKEDFENVEHLPEELWRYKQFHKENQESPKSLFLGTSKFNMYLQDPFQHNVNITARVTPKMFEKFIKACVEEKSKPKS